MPPPRAARRTLRNVLLLATTLGQACAPQAQIDEDETSLELFAAAHPVAHFDPARGMLPIPNNLLLDPSTGRLDLPAECGESLEVRLLRDRVLSAIDGFASNAVIRATSSAAIDLTTLEGRAFLFRLQDRGLPAAASEEPPVPLDAVLGTATIFDPACTATDVWSLTLVPQARLIGGSTYGVALLSGITDQQGRPLTPSLTWGLIRQETAPVEIEYSGTTPVVVRNDTSYDPLDPKELARLVEISQLWQAHHQALSALSAALSGAAGVTVSRSEILLAWTFNTQTLTEPLDPAVAQSPAALLARESSNALTITRTLSDRAAISSAFAVVLDPSNAMAGAGGACAALGLPCDKVGSIIHGTLTAPDYQTRSPAGQIGPWSDPYQPVKRDNVVLQLLAFTPDDATAPLSGAGRPTVVFGHDLASSKEALFAIASQLAAAGFNSVAIDWVGHGSRAVRVSAVAAAGCGGTPSPMSAPHCYQPFFSADIATTRDNLRQSALDLQKLTLVLRECGASSDCGALRVDPERIAYLHQSLGSLIGALDLALDTSVTVGVLNAPAAGLADLLLDTQSAQLRCPLVDGLIAAGILAGQRWLGINPNALCLGDDWRAEPALHAFMAEAQWALEPADPATFAARLSANRAVLLQEVHGDDVISNRVTDRLAALLGVTPIVAHTGAPSQPSGDADSGARGHDRALVVYETNATNVYTHESLLRPAAGGALGTQQLQTDALNYLLANLTP